MNIKPEDVELSITGNIIKSPSHDELVRMVDWRTTPVQCPACGQFGLHACPSDSPWRSLTNDPPTPPTEATSHALLVRNMSRGLADDRYRQLVPYTDSDNGGVLRWFESHLDYVLEELVESGYTEWMEVPK